MNRTPLKASGKKEVHYQDLSSHRLREISGETSNHNAVYISCRFSKRRAVALPYSRIVSLWFDLCTPVNSWAELDGGHEKDS